MAAASQRDLDPRQVKAREEFERMREQLTRSLERPVDPAPWRERARERVAAFERETLRKRPLAVATHKARWPRWAPLAAAFALGVLFTATAALVVLRDPGGPETAEAPFAAFAPSSATAAPVVAPPVVARPEPAPIVETAAPPVETIEVAAVEPTTPVAEEPNVEAQPDVSALVEEPAPPAVASASATRDPVVERIARVREIQSLLIAQGHALGRPDGDAGPQTISAASAFATAHGLADANLDEAFLAALRKAEAGYLVPLAPLAQRDPVLEQINRVRNAQEALNELGYALGRPDGDAGPQTLAAVEEFAASRDLADVAIDDAMVALLQQAADAR